MSLVEDPEQILATLATLAAEKRLSDGASLAEDGDTLTVADVVLAARTPVALTSDARTCTYTAAAIYLQIVDPDQRLLTYRNACKKYGVKDPIGALDKPVVVSYFFASASSTAAAPAVAAAPTEAPPVVAAEASREKSREEGRRHKEKSSRHRKDKESSKRKKDKHGSSSRDSEKKKKVKATVTNEELFSNLSVVVGKRTAVVDERVEQDKLAIAQALSTDGFMVTPALLEEYRERTQLLLAREIPVGDSASILRAANPRKDLSRVLEIFNETVNPKKTKAAARGGPHKKAAVKGFLIGKKPVIIVPNGMTAPITILNAHEFLSKGRFVPRGVMMKQQRQGPGGRRPPAPTTFTRQAGAAVGNGGLVEYEITDNPNRLLGSDPKAWERVVAVVVLGQGWQFSDWYFKYNDPVHLFSKAFGFFVSLEGDQLPGDVKNWAVRHAKLNRDKRGLDSVSSAAFWNGLDEFMAVHKRELLPQASEE
jgi:parafibromin